MVDLYCIFTFKESILLKEAGYNNYSYYYYNETGEYTHVPGGIRNSELPKNCCACLQLMEAIRFLGSNGLLIFLGDGVNGATLRITGELGKIEFSSKKLDELPTENKEINLMILKATEIILVNKKFSRIR